MSDDDFLSRWSRRKRSVADEEAVATAPEPVAEAEAESEEEEAELLAHLNLPVPETLQPGDDFSAFMADGVPAFLRKRALRVLWRSNPVLANLDGLNDYDEDFTSPELTQKVLATAYQVGRGFVSKTAQSPKSDEPEESVEDPAPDPASADESPVMVAENQTVEERATPIDEPPPSARPRRMRFEA